MPLRTNLDAMEGALSAVEAAVKANHDGIIRQYNVQDRRPGEFEGIRVSLSAGDGLYSGMRIFGNPPHTRAFMLFEGETRQLICLMDYGVLNSLRVGAIAGVAGRHLAPQGREGHGAARLRLAGRSPGRRHAQGRAVAGADQGLQPHAGESGVLRRNDVRADGHAHRARRLHRGRHRRRRHRRPVCARATTTCASPCSTPSG